jgi:hypothetical protein
MTPRWTTREIDAPNRDVRQIDQLKTLQTAIRDELAQQWKEQAGTPEFVTLAGLKAIARPDPDAAANKEPLLEEIANATKGKFFDSTSFSLSDVPLREPPLIEVGRSKDQPLWDRWYWLTVLIVVLGLEWAVRRRFGYV